MRCNTRQTAVLARSWSPAKTSAAAGQDVAAAPQSLLNTPTASRVSFAKFISRKMRPRHSIGGLLFGRAWRGLRGHQLDNVEGPLEALRSCGYKRAESASEYPVSHIMAPRRGAAYALECCSHPYPTFNDRLQSYGTAKSYCLPTGQVCSLCTSHVDVQLMPRGSTKTEPKAAPKAAAKSPRKAASKSAPKEEAPPKRSSRRRPVTKPCVIPYTRLFRD